MLTAALVSLGVVFVAELGDKSQLMTMTYALRHRWWVVLSGVAHRVIPGARAVGDDRALPGPDAAATPDRVRGGDRVPRFRAVDVARGPQRRHGDDVKVAEPRFVLFAVISSFVLAELGDKTMLATVALASDHNWAGVWIGATAGMVLADGVAIAVGALMHGDCLSVSCTAWPACCSCCSACGSCSTAPSACDWSRWRPPGRWSSPSPYRIGRPRQADARPPRRSSRGRSRSEPSAGYREPAPGAERAPPPRQPVSRARCAASQIRT